MLISENCACFISNLGANISGTCTDNHDGPIIKLEQDRIFIYITAQYEKGW